MEVGIRKGPDLWSLRWVYAVKKTRRLVYAVYPRIPPPIHHWAYVNMTSWVCSIEYLTTLTELVLPTFNSWTVHKIIECLTIGQLCSCRNIYHITTAYFFWPTLYISQFYAVWTVGDEAGPKVINWLTVGGGIWWIGSSLDLCEHRLLQSPMQKSATYSKIMFGLVSSYTSL